MENQFPIVVHQVIKVTEILDKKVENELKHEVRRKKTL